MKIVLDLTKLVAEGKLTEAQARELQALARPQTNLLAISIMLAFGVVAIAAGIMALIPTAPTILVIGAVLIALGLGVSFRAGPQWWLLGTALTIVGALATSGGLFGVSEMLFGETRAGWIGFSGTAALFLALAITIRSSFLSALTVLAVAGLLGSSTKYDSASYFLIVQEPTITIAVFALLALLAYLLSLRLAADYERLAVVFSRVSLVMINFGFWIGSLWGDDPGHSWHSTGASHPFIPDYAYVVGWAVALIGVGIWATRANRRFVVNTVAAFGAIHFYTQWFERLGAEPLTILLAGVLVVAIAVGLWRYNMRPGSATAAA